MANFPTGKSLNLTLDGNKQLLPVTYKSDFYIISDPDNLNNIEIFAGDNEVKIWVLAPGDSWQVSSLTSSIDSAIRSDIPLKVQGTSGELLVGFLAK